MSPVVAEMVHTNGNTHQSQVLWWAGASANVVVLGLAERAGKPISFWGFSKYGLIVTAVTVALAVPYLWLRYFAFT